MELTAATLKPEYDVVICGAGLAGLTLARQLTRELPRLSLLLIEGVGDKSRTGAIQVGESTVELSANYLVNVVGLGDYLEAAHYHKWGLRFFFGRGHTPLQDRPEVGTSHASPINSYQLDRALMERDIKQLNQALGIQMLRESKVEDIVLAGEQGLHEVKILETTTGQRQTVRCRWVIDAAGRRRLLQKKLGIAQPANPLYSASWFRLKGRVDVCDLVPPGEEHWHRRVPENNRYYSTNHLMDKGRWVWLIPLASGNTSIGIVTNEDYHPFGGYNTYEKAGNWLAEHEPLLWEMIKDNPPLDFQCLRHYSYIAKQVFSTQRWACTGDAAIFSDPFFSPGIDQIGFANTLISEMLKREAVGQLQPELVESFNEAFLSFHSGVVWITQPAYAFYDDGLVMGAKLVWDFARGFSINGAARFNHIYLDEQKKQALAPVLSRLFVLTLRVEKLLRAWAALRAAGRGQPCPYAFIDYFGVPGMLELYNRNFQMNKSVEELVSDHQHTLEYLEELTQIIFLLALADTMPEQLSQLPTPLWLNAWGVGLDPRRWKTDKLFEPASRPRSLDLARFAALFGFPQETFAAWLALAR
jgi:flavin-dependent dehydrogenase